MPLVDKIAAKAMSYLVFTMLASHSVAWYRISSYLDWYARVCITNECVEYLSCSTKSLLWQVLTRRLSRFL